MEIPGDTGQRYRFCGCNLLRLHVCLVTRVENVTAEFCLWSGIKTEMMS